MRLSKSLPLIAVVLVRSASAQGPDRVEPFFASHAEYIYMAGSAISPDGASAVSARQLDEDATHTEVNVKGPSGTFRAAINFGLNAQVLWSGDSKAFAITGSSEGANGQYQTDVFYIDSGRLRRVPLTLLLERAFGHPVRCGWPESPNVVALEWLEGSKTLLLATQIIHHSNCDSFGTFRGFVVDVENLRVVKRFNQIEEKHLLGSDLGPWLQHSDDKCVRNPRSCWVSDNHPELVGKAR